MANMLRNVVPGRASVALPGSGAEILKFVFPRNEYGLVTDTRPMRLAALQVHWFVLSDKDIWLKNGIDQHFYNLVTGNGHEVWGVSEHTFWHIGLWQVPYPERLAGVPAKVSVVTSTGLDARRS
jgi:hypothetical protein